VGAGGGECNLRRGGTPAGLRTLVRARLRSLVLSHITPVDREGKKEKKKEYRFQLQTLFDLTQELASARASGPHSVQKVKKGKKKKRRIGLPSNAVPTRSPDSLTWGPGADCRRASGTFITRLLGVPNAAKRGGGEEWGGGRVRWGGGGGGGVLGGTNPMNGPSSNYWKKKEGEGKRQDKAARHNAYSTPNVHGRARGCGVLNPVPFSGQGGEAGELPTCAAIISKGKSRRRETFSGLARVSPSSPSRKKGRGRARWTGTRAGPLSAAVHREKR